MDPIHELCPVQLLQVSKKSDILSVWLASIQHLAHIYKGNSKNMEWWSFIMRRWHYQFYFSIISNAFLYISLNYHRTIRIYAQDYRIGNRESGNSYSIAKLFLLSTFPDICQIIINYGLFYIIFSNWSFVAWLPSCSCTASAPVQSIKVNVYSSSY